MRFDKTERRKIRRLVKKGDRLTQSISQWDRDGRSKQQNHIQKKTWYIKSSQQERQRESVCECRTNVFALLLLLLLCSSRYMCMCACITAEKPNKQTISHNVLDFLWLTFYIRMSSTIQQLLLFFKRTETIFIFHANFFFHFCKLCYFFLNAK